MRPVRLAEHVSLISARRFDLRGPIEEILSPTTRFAWEVGCGHGHFLTAYSKAHPGKICLGVDIMSDRISRANRKRERARLADLHFVRSDAEDFLAVMPQGARFTSIFVLFPDPWPKRRHHKNRVMNAPFLAAVAARSGNGTLLHFRTDHEPYFKDTAELLRHQDDWSEVDISAWEFEEPTVFQKRSQSHFSLVARRR